MALKAHFDPRLYIWFRLSLLLIFSLTIAISVHGQSALYHLHAENSAGTYQLKTAGPDASSSVLQSANLKNAANGDYVIAGFATLSGVPNITGTIPAGSGVSVSVWLRKTSSQGAMYPRAKLYLNSASGPLVAVLTGSTPLTTTVTKYTFGMTLSSNVSMTASDRFYLSVGVTVTAKSAQNNQAELSLEGALNGNYDSVASVPLPVPPIPPSISSVSPTAATIGTSVTITGANFGPSVGFTKDTATVTFNDVNAFPTSWSNTSITVPVPAGASTGPVVVWVKNLPSNGAPFTVTPRIDGLTPTLGVVGSSVTIIGTSFGATQGSGTVTFNGIAATPSSWSNQSIVVPVPVGATTGPVIVTASGYASNNATFIVAAPGTVAGKITNTSGGAAIGGASVQALQSGVLKASASSAANGDYTLSNLQSGTYEVRVTAPGYQVRTQNGVIVTANNTTTLNLELTPTTQSAIAGTITRTSDGATLSGASVQALQDGAVKASVLSAANGIYTFSAQSGTYDIRVSAPGYHARTQNGVVVTENTTTTVDVSLDTIAPVALGAIRYIYDEPGRLVAVVTPTEVATYTYDTVGNLLSISRGDSSQVSIIEFTPNSGAIGATVTIYGTGFSTTANQNVVKFNGVTANVTSATTTELVTQVPAGATTGPIAVTTPAGTATSNTSFIVGNSAAPTITGFTPTIGVAGTPVTITGTNFESVFYNNRVEFNQTLSTVTSATNTTISTTVPTAAATGRISVSTVGGTVTSSDDFIIAPPPYTPADVEVTGRMAIGQSKVVSITNPTKIAIIVFDGVAGQWVSLGMTNTTLSPSTCCNTVAIYRPDGTALLPSTSFTVSGGGTPSVQLPWTGTYSIVVDPTDVQVGSVTLRLSEDISTPISINGPPVVLQFTHVGQNSRLLFSGNAGQWVSIGTSDSTISAVNCCSSSTVAIYKPDGATLLAPFAFFQAGGGTPSVQLPVTGNYAIVVEPFNNLLGSVTLTLSEDLSPPISINGPAVTLTNRVGQNARLLFTGTVGQWVSVGVSDTNIGAVSCCTTSKVSILKPDGTALLAPFDFYQAGAGTPSVQLPATGVYAVFVDPLNGLAGNATITLSEDLSPPISINGPPVTLTNRVGQNARLLFSGTAGQWVSVGVSDTTIGAVSCCTTSKVSILKPDGTTLLAPFDFYQAGAGTPSVQLPVSGTYAIFVDPLNGLAGNTTITLSEDLSPPISINGPPVTLTNRVGQNARLLFSGTAGQWVSVGVSDTTIGAASCCTTSKVSILKPDGTALLAPFDFYQAGAGTPSVQLPVSGTYAIFVDPINAVTGNTTITLSEDLSPPISINGPPVILTNRPGQNARLLFSGNAGQWVSVGVSDTTIGAPSCCTTSKVSILKPDGTALVAPLDFYQAGVGTPSVQLPVSGTYAIFVDPYNAVAGNTTITLSEDLTPQISINGPAVTLTNRAGQNARLSFSGNAGQWVSLGLTDMTIGAPSCCTTSKVAIYKPDGTVLFAPTDFYQPIGTPSLQLPTTGTYTIIVDPYNAVSGNVTLTLSEDLSPPISINGGGVTLTNRAGQNARLSFNGNAGQWISLVVSDVTIAATSCCTSTTIAIYKPDGTTLLAPVAIPQAGVTTQSIQLPVSGSYVILLDPYNAVAGNATVALWEDLSPPISINGPPVVLQFTHVGQNSRLLFSGNAGQWVSIGTSDSTISAVNCCSSSTVAIYKPDGATLLAPFTFFQAGGGTPSVQLPVTGNYAIVVEPFNNLLGSVTLTLSEDLSPPISINGAAVTLTNRVGQNARLPFSGTAGQWVSVGVSDTNIAAVSCCTTSKVSILKPDGTTLLAPFDFYQVGAGTPSVQLPVTGSYAIFVDPLNGLAGNATITLSEDLSPPISINGPPVTLTNRPGQNARLLFSGTAGQWITLGVSNATIGAPSCCTTSTVTIYKPDGTTLLATLGFLQNGIATASIQLPVTGTYLLVVDPYNAVAGNVTLTLSEDLSPSLSINGAAVPLDFNRVGQNARVVFAGAAGQQVTVRVTGNTITGVTVRLLRPDGTEITSTGSSNSSFNLATQTLPTTGTYTIIVDPNGTNTGSLNISVTNP